MKLCKKCNINKPLIDFGKHKIEKDGLYSNCKVCRNTYNTIWREANVQKTRDSRKRSYYKYRSKEIIYAKNRYNSSIVVRLKHSLRTRLSKVINKTRKGKSTLELLGCSLEQFKTYLEAKFYNNPETGIPMSWNNYSHKGWHIDHKLPLSSFNLTNKEELCKACHYTNLQPLWAKDNLIKGSELMEEFKTKLRSNK